LCVILAFWTSIPEEGVSRPIKNPLSSEKLVNMRNLAGFE